MDIVLPFNKNHYIAAEQTLKKLGLLPRLPVTASEVFDFREEYINNRNLFAWSFYDAKDPTQVLDIIITYDLSKLKIKKAEFKGHTLPVLALRDLIAMKRKSGRPQDLEDIRALEDLGT